MKKILLLLFSLLLTCGRGQTIISASHIATDDTTIMRFIYSGAEYNVKTYKVVYHTTDIDGSATVASGAIMIPQVANCDHFPLISYSHGTVLLRDDVPSRNNGEALIPKLIASTGRIAVSADYLGLGDNPGLHPYLHAESEATATLDLIRAAREYIQDSLGMSLNGEVFITGYSQGGHAAMATVKYIQDHNLQSEFNVLAAGPASGPYNLSGTQSEVLMSNQPYSNPGYVCYLLFAYNRVYGNLFSNYSDILKPPYDQTIPAYFDGTYSMSTVNALLPAQISGFIQDSVLTNFKNDSVNKTHPLWQALMANDNYDWTPSIPMELYYCTMDEQVDYHNSLDAETAMQANGASNVTAVNRGSLNHGNCVFPALQAAIMFFDQYDTPCQKVGIPEEIRQLIKIYPNPAHDAFSISGLEEEAVVSLYDIRGELVRQEHVIPGEKVSVRGLSAGVYIIKGKGETVAFSSRLMLN